MKQSSSEFSVLLDALQLFCLCVTIDY